MEVTKEIAIQLAPLLQKAEQDQDPIASQDSTNVDRQVQFRMADDNVLLSPQTLVDTVANASKEGDEKGQSPQAPLPQREDHQQDSSLMDHRQDLEPDLGQPLQAPLPK